MSSLKKSAKCVQYVHRLYRLEGICLFIYPFSSASLLVVVHFCRYVFRLVNKNQSYGCSSVTNLYFLKFMITNIYVTKIICNKFKHKVL
jgi:hypothetical protein